MKSTITLLLLFLISITFTYAQKQTLKGQVVDKSTGAPIVGAAVILGQDSIQLQVTTSDFDGNFRFAELPFGRYYIDVQFIGYTPHRENDVYVRGGNQTVLILRLSETSYSLDEVVLTAVEMKGDAQNEFSVLSAKTFSIDETERYAGTRGDPARMAANYAGVVGNDDNSNDIVVRGNTPIGILWRMDGVNIPSPNHFAVAGTTGGPVTILNNQTLSNSDFLTGAFSGEYGNTVAGVFDLKTRNGNNEKHEFSGELGFLGVKARAEGPFKKGGKSSYLVAYRYSTLAMFEALNVDIGTESVPQYQDLNFKLNVPINSSTNLSVFGMGGTSKIDIEKSTSDDPFGESYGNSNTDEYFRSSMGVSGMTLSKTLNDNTFMQLTVSYSQERQGNTLYYLNWDSLQEPPQYKDRYVNQGYQFKQGKAGAALNFVQKLSLRSVIKYGVFVDHYLFDFRDSIFDKQLNAFETRIDFNGNGTLIQPYINWKYEATEKLSIVLGIHGQYLNFNGSKSIEPRMGANYKLDDKQSLEFGVGQHSQMIPTYIYFIEELDQQGNSQFINKDVDFLRSTHFVLGYNRMLNPQLRFKAETYYQHLFNVPVTVTESSYSILNEGADANRFFPDSLNNDGTGSNYGIEFTLEKFFSRDYFFMVNTSLFSSTYQASDGNTYNTVFNSGYVFNILGAKEFFFGEQRNNKLSVGAKFTTAGGRRYSPLDEQASEAAGYAIYDDEKRNTLQFDPYLRFDVNLKYRMDRASVGHEFGLDLVNLLDIENVLSLEYNPVTNESYTESQLGFLPIFYYRIDF